MLKALLYFPMQILGKFLNRESHFYPYISQRQPLQQQIISVCTLKIVQVPR